MSEVVQIRLLLGVSREDMINDEPPVPVVAGCMDMTVWEIVDAEESDATFAQMREAFGGGAEYEWREVVAAIDAESLRSVFATLKVEALVGVPDA